MNSGQPLVSVITLTYNSFDRLFETMKSVFMQDYNNIEYIISDDGSKNFPTDEVNEFIKNNNHNSLFDFRIIRQSENCGTVKNINNAYKSAKGEIFINLSCGDMFFEKDTVSKIIDRFRTTDSQVIVTSRLAYKDDREILFLLPRYEEREIITSQLDTKDKQYRAFIMGEYYDMASGSAMYFTRDVMEEFDYFDESYTLWEDGPFLAKYLWKYPLEYAYDIISIWYEKTGISSKPLQLSNPLLIADTLNFNNTERVQHISSFTRKEKKRINFVIQYAKCKNQYEKMRVRIRFLLQYLHFYCYSAKRRKRIRRDLDYINQLFKTQE